MSSKPMLVLAIMAFIPLSLVVAVIASYITDHPHPIRAWRLKRGPQESCFKCGSSVPLGLIEARRAHYQPLFGIRFEDQLDGAWEMRGLGGGGSGWECAICGTSFKNHYVPAPTAEKWSGKRG